MLLIGIVGLLLAGCLHPDVTSITILRSQAVCAAPLTIAPVQIPRRSSLACSVSACCQHALHPASVRCDMVLHKAFRARRLPTKSIGGEVRHGVTSDVSRERRLKHEMQHLTSKGSADRRRGESSRSQPGACPAPSPAAQWPPARGSPA